jgi:hypothetical protein
VGIYAGQKKILAAADNSGDVTARRVDRIRARVGNSAVCLYIVLDRYAKNGRPGVYLAFFCGYEPRC